MGSTNRYSLPWPESTAAVRDGWNAIKLLAQATEAALAPPLLVTDGDGTLTWTDKVAEVPWDVTDNPDRRRGSWSSAGSNERLVMPGLPGWYLVQASVRFSGKAEPDIYEVAVRTRQQGSDVGTGVGWGSTRVELPGNSTSFTQLNIATIVRIAETNPSTGFAVRLTYAGSTQPPSSPAGSNKLRAYRLSAL